MNNELEANCHNKNFYLTIAIIYANKWLTRIGLCYGCKLTEECFTANNKVTRVTSGMHYYFDRFLNLFKIISA